MTGAETTRDLATRIARLEHLQEIQQLVHRYAIAVDSRDLESILTMFVDDVDCGRFGVGREALRASFEVAHRDFYRSLHLVCGHVVDITGPESASGTVVMRAEHEVDDSWVVVAVCLFDTYARRDGKWYFVRRKPESWYTADVLERPQDARGWPGRDQTWGRLPERFPTWSEFWAGHEETVARLTRAPRP